ncbi:hypothetical protein WN944_009625 [Citrus x changshan-huyou]|uniref:Uncharacterized protein n=1 Tax=Citrus x changshan-huyou TaxID=2935761 RepID=A0AAP0MS25_9ROSI
MGEQMNDPSPSMQGRDPVKVFPKSSIQNGTLPRLVRF